MSHQGGRIPLMFDFFQTLQNETRLRPKLRLILYIISIKESESDLNITETCLELENGTEVCTSNDETKPHLTLNSHIISG